MSFLSGLAGGLGGLATGGPLGAAAGAAAGFLGGDDNQRQTTRFQLRDLSQQRKAIIDQIEEAMPGLLSSLSPQARDEMAAKFEDLARKKGITEVRKTFRDLRKQHKLDMARTGGSLGSVDLYAKREFGRGEAEALDTVRREATLFGENVASGRARETLGTLGTFQNAISGFEGLRTLGAGSTVTQNQNPLGGASMLLGYAATDEDSWLRRQGDKLFG